MAASSFIYNYAKAGWAGGSANLCNWSSTTASYYITLLSNNYVPNETHSAASQFSGAELSSASFTAGFNGTIRISLTGRVLNTNNTSNQIEFQCNGVSWAGISAGTAAAFVVIQQVTNDANSPIICYNSLAGFPVLTNNTTFTLSTTSAGIFNGIDA